MSRFEENHPPEILRKEARLDVLNTPVTKEHIEAIQAAVSNAWPYEFHPARVLIAAILEDKNRAPRIETIYEYLDAVDWITPQEMEKHGGAMQARYSRLTNLMTEVSRALEKANVPISVLTHHQEARARMPREEKRVTFYHVQRKKS